VPALDARARLVTAATWPVGIALTSWAYLWRTTPLHRSELEGSPSLDAEPVPADRDEGAELQLSQDGVGALFHRRYRTRIRDTSMSAEELMARLTADLNQAAPSSFARFVAPDRDRRALRAGDELIVRMPGPWDGPVRVSAIGPTSFELVTLEGHLEAGRIRFTARRRDRLEFEIEAWARSGGWFSNLLYTHLRMAKEVQLHMWVSFLEGIVRLSGGRMSGGIEIETWRLEDPRERESPERRDRLRDVLERLRRTPLNFDPVGSRPHTRENGWHVDDFVRALPPERPGSPEPHGSFEIAKGLLTEYAMAPPETVRPFFDSAEPLGERTMLLEIRYHGLRLHVGVRVLDVYDRELVRDGRPARVWGWSYGTLQGHFEVGKLDWQVWKWLDTGEVEYRTHAYSRPADDANPFVRLGFRAVGRREQLAFMHATRERMARLTRHALEARSSLEDAPDQRERTDDREHDDHDDDDEQGSEESFTS
jgi:uncharacterized protein (UPF0548 family)